VIRKTVILLSTLGALTALVAGVASFWRGVPDDTLWISSLPQGPQFQWTLIRGTLHAVYSDTYNTPVKAETENALAGFYFKRTTVGADPVTGTRLATGVGIPFWPAVVVLAVYPTVALYRGPVRRRRRRSANLCTRCGYDLTGNVSGRCPECGLVLAANAEHKWDLLLRGLELFRPRRVVLFTLTFSALAIAAIWIASFCTFRSIKYTICKDEASVIVDGGGLVLWLGSDPDKSFQTDTAHNNSVVDLGVVQWSHACKRMANRRLVAPTRQITWCAIDLWAVFSLLAIYPAVTFVLALRRRRRPKQAGCGGGLFDGQIDQRCVERGETTLPVSQPAHGDSNRQL
jgi:hypothetical protein